MIARIRHCHNWGGMPADRWMWEGCVKEGDDWKLFDWSSKEDLINQANIEGWDWFVLRYHRDLTVSIQKSNLPKNEWPDVSELA